MEKRLYQEWKGSNMFIFGGRIIFGPDANSLLITVSLILIPVTIFCVFVGRNLLRELSSHTPGTVILAVAVVFTFYVLVMLLLTSSRDPGIVPRAPHPPEIESAALQFPRTKEVLYKGVAVKVKYCDTCMVFRPPRCSHCSICNNCVERFDHHCPWVGQCIGLRNYRYFFVFVSSSTVLCVYIFAMSALNINCLMDGDYPTAWKAMKHSPVSVILMLYCFISLWFVGGLTCFHLYLIATNQTTYENFRYRADGRRSVVDNGCPNNFAQVFCTKIPDSRNKFRSFVGGEEVPQPLHSGEPEERGDDDLTSGPRSKVEDDLELGGDLLKFSQRRRNFEDFDNMIIDNNSDLKNISSRSRRGRSSGDWEDNSPDILAANSSLK